MHKSCIINYSCHKHHLDWFAVHYLTKASCEIVAFLSKFEKSAKEHKLCIIMLINPFWYNFLEKNIFDLQTTIDRVHPVKIWSCSDYGIT